MLHRPGLTELRCIQIVHYSPSPRNLNESGNVWYKQYEKTVHPWGSMSTRRDVFRMAQLVLQKDLSCFVGLSKDWTKEEVNLFLEVK